MNLHINYQNIQSNHLREIKNSKNDFSFERNIVKTIPQDSIKSQNRYEAIKIQLLSVQNNILLDISVEWLKENDNLKAELMNRNNQKIRYEQQNKSLKQALKQKRQEIQLMTSNQQKNRHLIQKLELRLKANSKHTRQNNQINRDMTWQIKYKNLAKYMDQYINQTNEVQQQFQRNFFIIKNENERLLQCQSELKKSINQLEFKNKILCQKLSNTLIGIQQFRSLKFNQKQISDLKNIHQQIKTSINRVNQKKVINDIQKQSPIKEQNDKPKTVQQQQIIQMKNTIINLQKEVLSLKSHLKESEEQIEDLEINNNMMKKQMQQLVKQNLQIRKFQNDQTEKFIKQIKLYQQQINNIKQNQQNHLAKNIKNTEFSSQDKQNIKANIIRSLSLKSMIKPAVYVPPLNLKATINNQQISYKLMDKNDMKQNKLI